VAPCRPSTGAPAGYALRFMTGTAAAGSEATTTRRAS